MREHWSLDPTVTFLNHGSFGACPTAVLAHQRALQDRMERQPLDFYARDWWHEVNQAREQVAAFVGADPAGFVFVRNATEGVNAVLRSFPLNRGDEVLVTDHEYRACRFALDFVCERAGATVVEVQIPFLGYTPEDAAARILAAVTPRTRLALLDHAGAGVAFDEFSGVLQPHPLAPHRRTHTAAPAVTVQIDLVVAVNLLLVLDTPPDIANQIANFGQGIVTGGDSLAPLPIPLGLLAHPSLEPIQNALRLLTIAFRQEGRPLVKP